MKLYLDHPLVDLLGDQLLSIPLWVVLLLGKLNLLVLLLALQLVDLGIDLGNELHYILTGTRIGSDASIGWSKT